jgi:FtsP/CotA-like multicopper oxidase with cupredoxin domain
MLNKRFVGGGISALVLASLALPAAAQTFSVQCPQTTSTHPDGTGIKCQQISGGDGFATMGDGTQTYLFAFGPLSGLSKIWHGQPGTDTNTEFNQVLTDPIYSGLNNLSSPTGSALVGVPKDGGFSYNGAIGLVPDPDPPLDLANNPICALGGGAGNCLTGHVDPRPIMDVGVLNGSEPAPMMAIDEDDEFFLTLTNVGMIMRPDLFEQHTVHFHGYPNASSFYDGVPDASIAINIGGSFTYYYLAPDAGTYFWHCHITPPEHLQMGMVGQLYVRPRQNRTTGDLYSGLVAQQGSLRTKCDSSDILCTNPLPAINTSAVGTGTSKYAYNDGDGSTRYDVEYPIQMHGFDPNFHFVGMTFNPESFIDLKDKYFLLNGRSYPDTIHDGPLHTQSADGVERYSQPLPAIVKIPAGGRALLRISDLNVTEYHTLASLGIPMHVVGINAKLLRDQDGNNMAYDTNSITLGGGESLDVILDASKPEYAGCTAIAPCTFYLYTPQLDHLSNDAENFGGMMTEVRITAN